MTAYRIGVVGCAGRMGRMVVREIAASEGATLVGGTERPGAAELGQDLGELAGIGRLGVAVGDDPVTLFANVDAVIDFTGPAATVIHADLAAQARAVLISGATGLSAEQSAILDRASHHTAIVRAANMSLGVNLLLALAERAAAALGPDYDIEIMEIHHRHKVDAPSGTALALGEAVAAARGVELGAAAKRGRDGHTGPRPRGEIGFAALRGGSEIGDHTVFFCGEGERLELTHRAGGREIYAKGAVRAAFWARHRPPGLYGMRDVLGL